MKKPGVVKMSKEDLVMKQKRIGYWMLYSKIPSEIELKEVKK